MGNFLLSLMKTRRKGLTFKKQRQYTDRDVAQERASSTSAVAAEERNCDQHLAQSSVGAGDSTPFGTQQVLARTFVPSEN